MREGLVRLNLQHRQRLSNDLGAVAALMFDIGAGRYAAPPRLDDAGVVAQWQADLQRVREESAAAMLFRHRTNAGPRAGTTVGKGSKLFLVAPDSRRGEVSQQLKRPAFSRVSELGIRYLPYSQLQEHGAAISRFGAGMKPLLAISQLL